MRRISCSSSSEIGLTSGSGPVRRTSARPEATSEGSPCEIEPIGAPDIFVVFLPPIGLCRLAVEVLGRRACARVACSPTSRAAPKAVPAIPVRSRSWPPSTCHARPPCRSSSRSDCSRTNSWLCPPPEGTPPPVRCDRVSPGRGCCFPKGTVRREGMTRRHQC